MPCTSEEEIQPFIFAEAGCTAAPAVIPIANIEAREKLTKRFIFFTLLRHFTPAASSATPGKPSISILFPFAQWYMLRIRPNNAKKQAVFAKTTCFSGN